jgi:hypothetical protein
MEHVRYFREFLGEAYGQGCWDHGVGMSLGPAPSLRRCC